MALWRFYARLMTAVLENQFAQSQRDRRLPEAERRQIASLAVAPVQFYSQVSYLEMTPADPVTLPWWGVRNGSGNPLGCRFPSLALIDTGKARTHELTKDAVVKEINHVIKLFFSSALQAYSIIDCIYCDIARLVYVCCVWQHSFTCLAARLLM